MALLGPSSCAGPRSGHTHTHTQSKEGRLKKASRHFPFPPTDAGELATICLRVSLVWKESAEKLLRFLPNAPCSIQIYRSTRAVRVPLRVSEAISPLKPVLETTASICAAGKKGTRRASRLPRGSSLLSPRPQAPGTACPLPQPGNQPLMQSFPVPFSLLSLRPGRLRCFRLRAASETISPNSLWLCSLGRRTSPE